MKKIFAAISLLFIIIFPAFSQNKKSWSFDLTSDIVYYPFCDFIEGQNHFSPISGPLDTAAFRITGAANYIVPCPLGEHWLVQDSTVIFKTSLQITPVSMRSINKIVFTPVPFLEFEAGSSFGIGWNFSKVKGLSKYNPDTNLYEDLSTCKNLYYDIWGMGTFQFDTGAVIPGDWNHVVMLAQYQLIYKGLSGLKKYDIYNWQTVTGQTKGLQFASQIILAYQMPIVLYRTGIISEFSGHINTQDYGPYSQNYDGDFVTMLFSPFVQFKFKNGDTLSVLLQFSNRRSFSEPHTKLTEEMTLTKIGNEWFVNMLAASWTHFFN